jgi:hypothetical protein
MALFIDGPANSVDGLTEEDSGLLETAQTCGINVNGKLRVAWEEMHSDLYLWLERPKGATDFVWNPTQRVDQIVVSHPLRRWERMSALAHVYRDAYFSQLVDRYQAKWDEYTALARKAREIVVATGLDLVSDPIRKAAPPAVGEAPGAGSGGMFYASVAWLNAAGEEGQASDAASITTPPGEYMTVSAVDAPANAMGFNVYAGAAPNAMTLQNSAALAPGSAYTSVPGATSTGRRPGEGQQTQIKRRLTRTILRG